MSNNYSTVHIVGCNAEADIRDVSQSSPLGNFSIEHANESVCDNTLTIEEGTILGIQLIYFKKY